MKKYYTKPEAELVSFYSAEELTNTDDTVSETYDTVDLPDGWS